MFKKLLIAIAALGCHGLQDLACWRGGRPSLRWRCRLRKLRTGTDRQGEALAGGGYCAACHTAKDGERLAGGYGMATRSA